MDFLTEIQLETFLKSFLSSACCPPPLLLEVLKYECPFRDVFFSGSPSCLSSDVLEHGVSNPRVAQRALLSPTKPAANTARFALFLDLCSLHLAHCSLNPRLIPATLKGLHWVQGKQGNDKKNGRFPLSQGTYSFWGVNIKNSTDHEALRSHVSHMY